MKHTVRPTIVGVLLFVVATGIAFPLAFTRLAQAAFKVQANGSLITNKGRVVGSALIGQSFSRPEYMHPRPSAAGSGYDANASGGTNLGPTSDKLVNGVHKRTAEGKDDPSNFDGVADTAAAYRKENGLPVDATLPVDAVTRSGSGLDPHISLENARLQLMRIADARHMSESDVAAIVAKCTEPPLLGWIGEPCVNVLKVNLALDGH